MRETADRKEFLKISQAVAIGFVCMGAIGFLVKLSMFFYYLSSSMYIFSGGVEITSALTAIYRI